ncbi:hypothetical protein GIB67_012919, partial [Kingdonia uniflora]
VRIIGDLGFTAFAIIAGFGFDCLGFDGGGVVWVVVMVAVLRLGCSVIRVACPRDAVVGASGCLLGLILREYGIGLQVVSNFSCYCGDLWGAELEAHSPVIAVGLVA